MQPKWLEWARRLQAIGETGLTYTTNEYDVQRYTAIRNIAAEIMAGGCGAEPAAVSAAFARELGYVTPKVDVRAAVFQDGRILLVREREDNHWTLPGGWADIGESPGEAAARETKEESGYDVEPVKLLALYDRDRHGHPPIPYHAYKIFFLCDLKGGEPASSNETTGVAFFPENDLPPLSLTRVTPDELHHLFDHLRHPGWPASFD
ncbi:MAG: NUDIX hydrolase [Acidobacteriota bacterium]